MKRADLSLLLFAIVFGAFFFTSLREIWRRRTNRRTDARIVQLMR